MGGSVLQVESLFETTMGGRLTGQINIWRFPTSPHGLPVLHCFSCERNGVHILEHWHIQATLIFFNFRRVGTWVRLKKEQLPLMFVVDSVRRK